jgi:selenium metabolism protein YedF
MTTTVDARGLACPQPVIQTRKAMEQGDQVVTLVDNDMARANVERMAKKAGWEVTVIPAGNEFRIELGRVASSPEMETATRGKAEILAEPAVGPLVLVVSADTMGQGADELGGILMRSFFHTLGEVEPLPQTIVFFNAGVKLACQNSPVLEDLATLEAAGIEMLVCGTCLSYYELTGKLVTGYVSNMYDIAETMLSAGKVVNL